MDVNQEILRIFALQQSRAPDFRDNDLDRRRQRLIALRDAVIDQREQIVAAIQADFGKPEPETQLSEIMVVLSEIKHALKNLKRWTRPLRVRSSLAMFGTRAWVRQEPRGVCLIVAPWNYPFNLLMGPLVSAIAAGNTAMLKPSELTPNTSALMREMLHKLFPEDEVRVFEGETDVAQALLKLPFDHCFFTGSPAIGKLVMRAASEHLTSVTLELGGKSPVIVTPSADLDQVARSVAWGKFVNAGQSCTAPDYLFVHEDQQPALIEAFRKVVHERYGQTPQVQAANPDMARIVNERHQQRIAGLINEAVAKGARLEMGGPGNADTRHLPPTILTGIAADSQVLDEEIFGPVLPVITYKDLDETVAWINARPKPLALYIYGKDRPQALRLLHRTSSGDAAINTCMVHFSHPNLPFGGVNNSGIGKGHGRWGFQAFSHERAVLSEHFSSSQDIAPPYTPSRTRFARFVARYLS